MGSSANACRWSIIVAFLLLPLASSAQELLLGIGVDSAYDDNIFSSSIDQVDDYILRLSPSVTLEDHEGELRWDVRYMPSYDHFVQTREKSGWTQLANGKLSWQINPTTRLEASDRFGRYRSTDRFNEGVTLGEGDEVVDTTATGFRANRTIRNNIDTSLTHNLAQNRMLIFNLGHNLIDPSRDEDPDRQGLSITGQYLHLVTRRNTLGLGTSFRRSSFDSTSRRNSQSTDFYNVFGRWSYQFDETLGLNVALGPTWVQGEDPEDLAQQEQTGPILPYFNIEGERKLVRASTCSRDAGTLILTADCDLIDEDLPPELQADLDAFLVSNLNVMDLPLLGSVPSGSAGALTYFANMSLSKRWEQWSGSLSYRRTQSDASAELGSSTVADIVSGVLDWRPSLRWHSTLSINWTRQSSATDGVRGALAVESTDALVPDFGEAFGDVAQSIGRKFVTLDQENDITTLWLRLSVRYRLTKRTSLSSSLMYFDQSRGQDSGVGRDYDRLRVNFGVEYRFDPIRF